MEPEAVRSVLADRVETHRESLRERWGEVAHRERAPILVPEYDFPTTPDDIFPWVSVCFVVDDGEVLLVQDSDHSSAWEPPGGKGEHGESFSETAWRETREETGIECEITDLLFTETLRFDYGESVDAAVLQAGFLARRVGGEISTTEDAIETASWFPISDLPEGTQFAEDIRSLATFQ